MCLRRVGARAGRGAILSHRRDPCGSGSWKGVREGGRGAFGRPLGYLFALGGKQGTIVHRGRPLRGILRGCQASAEGAVLDSGW